MNVIVIAAGSGKRLRPFTHNTPKGLMKVGNTTIVGSQINIFRSLKLNEINIITGYKKNKFKFKNIKYFFNRDFKINNILCSLFYAKKKLNEDCLITYSDIIFKKKIVKSLLNIKDDIVIVVDKNWKKNYKERTLHPISEAEKAFYDKKKKLKFIGKNILLKNTNSEFIGMLKLSKYGAYIFRKYFDIAKKKYYNKKFYSSKKFQTAYITDFLKFLLRKKITIKCHVINSGWMEIDTTEDLVKAQDFFKRNSYE